jgi:hypothetical protein
MKKTINTDPSEIEIPKDRNPVETFFLKRNIPVFPSVKVDSAVTTLKEFFLHPAIANEIKEIRDKEPRVRKRFQPIFSLEMVPDISEKDFVDFLYIKHNGHWDRIYRTQKLLINDFDSVKSGLAILVNEQEPIHTRLDKIRPKSGNRLTPGAAEAILTAILHVEYPNLYGVWNGPSKDALEKLGLWPSFVRGTSFGEKYLSINEILKATANDIGLDLWSLDSLLYNFTTRPKKADSDQAGLGKR